MFDAYKLDKRRGQVRKPAPYTAGDLANAAKAYAQDVMTGNYLRKNLEPLAQFNRNTLANVEAYRAGQPIPYPVSGAGDDAIGQAMDMLTPMSKVGGIALTFAGQGAKNADLGMLKLAQEAESKGLPKEKIFDATGWFKGADDKWRFEIDDSAARLTPVSGAGLDVRLKADIDATTGGLPISANLEDIYSHPELEAAYMPTREVAPSINYANREGGTYYSRANNIEMDNAIPLSPAREKSLLSHELQHFVQSKEDFARGGNAAQFAIPSWKVEKQLDEISNLRDAQTIRQMMDAYNIGASEAGEIFSQFGRKPRPGALSSARYFNLDEIGRDIDFLKNKIDDPSGYKTYKKLAGEVEARNVQSRLGLLGDDRRMLAPWKTEDVPLDQQIVRYGNEPAMSSGAGTAKNNAPKYSTNLDLYDPPSRLFHGSGVDDIDVFKSFIHDETPLKVVTTTDDLDVAKMYGENVYDLAPTGRAVEFHSLMDELDELGIAPMIKGKKTTSPEGFERFELEENPEFLRYLRDNDIGVIDMSMAMPGEYLFPDPSRIINKGLLSE